MKIQVICESCNKIAEFVPVNNKSEIGIQTINKNFNVGVDWDNELVDNFQENFISLLSESNNSEEVKQILFHELSRNIYTETSDFDLCFTCKGCGEQIILNEFVL